MIDLRPFQKKFLKGALAPGIDTSALSLPRGNGKSFLAAHVLARCLTPGDDLHESGKEYLLCAASIEQARIVFKFVRETLEPSGQYRFLDGSTRLGITHVASNTKLRILSSNAKTAFGIVGCPILVADEPSSWEVNGGQLMNDAITTAQGKPNSNLRVIFIGTLAPSLSGWWHDLVADGSRKSTYVQALKGDPEKWDSWHEIRRCNPLTMISAPFRKKLIEERDQARRDSRLKARFLSYRLNVPSQDESSTLLTVDDWKGVLGREVPDRQGRPIVAIDLGGGRAWSAAVSWWQNGRVEAVALCGGVPNIEDQEKRDRVPKGVYQKLVDQGALKVCKGLRVPTPKQLTQSIVETFGRPVVCVADRFLQNQLRDAGIIGVPLKTRITRWSESTDDILALRKSAMDGPLSVEYGSRDLLTASLASAQVKNDDAGSCRLVKRDRANNTGRDDVAAALVLAAGLVSRQSTTKKPGVVYRGAS